MAVKNGSNVFVSLAGVRVNGLTSKNNDLAVDEIDITTQDSVGWKEFLAGEGSGTFSFEGMDDESDTYAYDQLFAALLAKASIAFTYGEGIETAGKRLVSGNCIITGLTKTDGKNTGSTYSCTCRIDGLPAISTSAATLA